MSKFSSDDVRKFLTPVQKPNWMNEGCGCDSIRGQEVDIDVSTIDPKDLFTKIVVALRGMQVWFHGAHVLAKGTGYAGDHVNLYGRIYTELDEQIDGAMEKAVGITGDEGTVCPAKIIKMLALASDLYGSPSNSSATEIARMGHEIVRDVLVAIELIYKVLKSHDMMTLGLEDFIAGLANTHEGYYYLLGQRIKNHLD